MKKKGFTLIELLAVIIILAVIALIATPIVLNVVDNARESARKSSVNGYADATRMAIYDYQFANNGSYPSVDKVWAEANAKTKGDTVNCEEVHFSTTFEVVMHKCTVGSNTKEYCHANGKTYEDCENEEYKSIYNSLGNIAVSGKDLTEELKKQYQESNTVGLLKEGNSYYYKGSNEEVANNFVWFGGHLWRVLTINEDNTLTMITQQPLTMIGLTSGNVWKTEQEYKDSYINHWLNDETDGVFLKSMDNTDKAKIQDNTFNIGINTNISEIVTTGKVGLLDQTQYEKVGGQTSFINIGVCFWLGNRSINGQYDMMIRVLSDGSLNQAGASERQYIRPVIKVSELDFIEGKGTMENPYREKSATTSTTNTKVGEYISVPTDGTDCGEDKKCLFRVVSKDSNSIKVILNGLLPNKGAFGSTATYINGNTIDTVVTTFANTISNTYRYTGNDKTFGIGTYDLRANYIAVYETEYAGNVGLPVIGEMFSGNDINVSTSIAKTFVNENTIENPIVSDKFWTMNAINFSQLNAVGESSLYPCDSNSQDAGIRPVLFLNNNLTFTGGEGTAENPFILE